MLRSQSELYLNAKFSVYVPACMVVSFNRVLITAVDKSTTTLPLVFFNNCFEDKNFNNGN